MSESTESRRDEREGGDRNEDRPGDEEKRRETESDRGGGKTESEGGHVTEDTDEMLFDLRKVSVLNQLGTVGIYGISHRLNDVGTSGDVELYLQKTDFLDMAERTVEIGDEEVVGIRADMEHVQGGGLLILFESDGAHRLASLLREDRADGETPDTPISNSEAQELIGAIGATMIGGFIGGWESALNRNIGHTPPEMLYGSGKVLVKKSFEGDTVAPLFTARLRFTSPGETAPEASVKTSIYTFMRTDKFAKLLNALGE